MLSYSPFRHFLSGIFLLLINSAYAQNHQQVIDSLRRVYQTGVYASPAASLDLLSRIAQEYQYFTPDSAISYASRVIRISEIETRSCPNCLARAYTAQGTAERQQGDYGEALVSFNQALAIYQAQADQSGITAVLDNLGLIARKMGNYPKAMDYFSRSLAVREMIGDSVGIARSFSVIAKVEIDKNQPLEARQHLQTAATVFQKYRLPYELGAAYHDIGKAHIIEGNADEALKFYMQAIGLWKTLGDKVQLQDSLSAYAEIFIVQNQFEKALIYIDEAMALTAKLNKKSDLLDLSLLKARALMKLQRNPEAAKMLIPTSQDAQELGRRGVEIRCYEYLIEIYDAAADKKQGDYYRQQLEEARKKS